MPRRTNGIQLYSFPRRRETVSDPSRNCNETTNGRIYRTFNAGNMEREEFHWTEKLTFLTKEGENQGEIFGRQIPRKLKS